MSQWIKGIKKKMIWLRRTIGHVTIIINSTNTDAFTNDKKNLQEKYYNKYDCTRLYTLQLSLMCEKVT